MHAAAHGPSGQDAGEGAIKHRTLKSAHQSVLSMARFFLARLFIVPLPFRASTKGVAFIHVVQAKHLEASRTKQPLRSPAPGHQCKASCGNGRGGNDEKA